MSHRVLVDFDACYWTESIVWRSQAFAVGVQRFSATAAHVWVTIENRSRNAIRGRMLERSLDRWLRQPDVIIEYRTSHDSRAILYPVVGGISGERKRVPFRHRRRPLLAVRIDDWPDLTDVRNIIVHSNSLGLRWDVALPPLGHIGSERLFHFDGGRTVTVSGIINTTSRAELFVTLVDAEFTSASDEEEAGLPRINDDHPSWRSGSSHYVPHGIFADEHFDTPIASTVLTIDYPTRPFPRDWD